MRILHKIGMDQIIAELPEIQKINFQKNFLDCHDDIFICVLGFEQRAKVIPHQLSLVNYTCDETIILEYLTNKKDNEINRNELEKSIKKFGGIITYKLYDKSFTDNFYELMRRISIKEQKTPKITFDISGCSSSLLLVILKILLDFNISLKIVYSEAQIYHPTQKEMGDINKIISEKGYEHYENNCGPTQGIKHIRPSKLHAGFNPDNLPNSALLFATFKPERNRSALTEIFLEPAFDKYEKRITWIVGEPHLKEDDYRIDFVKKINQIDNNSQCFTISTFNYTDCLENLEKIYETCSNYHVNVSALGSKMQTLGLALFHHIHPEITIYFSIPQKYDAEHYSEGCKAIWEIDFGEIAMLKKVLDKFGTLKITGSELKGWFEED